MQQPGDTGKESDLRRQDATLAAVRRRGAFLATALLLAAAAGGLIVTAGYVALGANAAMDFAERARGTLGLEVPAEGPDWYLIAVIAALVIVPLLFLLWLLRWYRGIWNRRTAAVWVRRGDRRRYSRMRRLRRKANGRETKARTAYLNALLASPGWAGTSRFDVNDGTQPAEAKYRATAERILREVEDDVAERAIATGLVVGVGPQRFDRLTIVTAALEMQLYVLSMLGKKPSLAAWREIVTRTSASLFLNTYLNGEDTFALDFAIRKAAIGLNWAGDATEGLADDVGGSNDGEGIGEFLGEFVGGLPVVGGVARSTASLALGVGAAGMQAVGTVIEEAGEELVQGALAGGILYYHGMAIAADVLALDEEHRRSPEMTRTAKQGAMRVAGVAGQMLRDQVRRYRGAYRQKNQAPLRAVMNRVPGRNTRSRPNDFLQLPEAGSGGAQPEKPHRLLPRRFRRPKRSDG